MLDFGIFLKHREDRLDTEKDRIKRLTDSISGLTAIRGGGGPPSKLFVLK